MEPSVELLKKIANNPNTVKFINRIKKEFEIFSYLNQRVPKRLGDSEWTKLLETRTVEERVAFWDFIALTQHRADNDEVRRERRRQERVKYLTEQTRIFDEGGIGYGPGLYQMHLDPFAQKKNALETFYDARQCTMRILDDYPTIALDLQYIPNEILSNRRRLCKNIQYLISENRTDFRRPFPLSFINVNLKDPLIKRFYDDLGFYNRTTRPGHFMPEVHEGNPFLSEKIRQEKEIIYVTKYANEMLDGPLQHDVYILPVTFDSKKESLGGARRGNFRTMSIPFKKYIKWQSGPMYIPHSNIPKVFDIVSRTGGDWEKALLANVSKRHLRTAEENFARNQRASEIARFRREERVRISEAIREALGRE